MAQPKQYSLTPDSSPETSSLLELSDVIVIDNNWTETVAMYDWANGSGTVEDPYIIQGINISSGVRGAGITIMNSAEHFVIKNSSFSDVVALYGHYIFAGIYIEKAEFGLIENCTFVNNYFGIAIYEAENMTIINNTFIGSHDDPLTGMGPAVYIDEGKEVNISYNYIKDYYNGVFIANSENNYVDHNHIENLIFGYTSDAGIYFDNVNNSAITNNDLYGCNATTQNSNLAIAGIGSNLAIAGIGSNPIFVNPNCFNILVRGNRFFDINGNLILSETTNIPGFPLPIVIGIVIVIAVIGISRMKRRMK